ncbi:hypothetical protein LPA44_01835 [Halobacterium sp. KA-4]|uniref:hypothetical protein n=1 Tax=Halobacterium sp. KA-4 TaxID=2896367 RepID=UPI001E2AC616|nr:hypothetical protein [Halobacterium sp. KA-4]MCD2198646.1 hypothetical protein [Halobacterium sp. KA-4]
MEQLAAQVRDALQAELPGGLIGVSYFDENGVGHVFRSEWAGEKYDPEQVDEVVRDIQLEALGYGSLEARQDQSLHATVRVYEDMLDVALPISQSSGIAFALDRDANYDLREAIHVAEGVVDESAFERPAVE